MFALECEMNIRAMRPAPSIAAVGGWPVSCGDLKPEPDEPRLLSHFPAAIEDFGALHLDQDSKSCRQDNPEHNIGAVDCHLPMHTNFRFA
ncbi:MAG: hypothetical protein AAFR16_14945 [Pseudomonadota bacterium]